ncbi:hypothetical protein [Salinisphaera sp.]|uniref:hypothetical protein n=1 Tax=Salinisphaera sp. TaxID=1914330 RepID=UPI000C5A5186|nr:hypothetical protein [Salinisphaera sp.]MAS09932.1 hypothetical protein [Salinisphaera sp.]|tara:strand:- start:4447 stop:4743 length:297 start_codon:yes stop_codon:yes gene_type:complete
MKRKAILAGLAMAPMAAFAQLDTVEGIGGIDRAQRNPSGSVTLYSDRATGQSSYGRSQTQGTVYGDGYHGQTDMRSSRGFSEPMSERNAAGQSDWGGW